MEAGSRRTGETVREILDSGGRNHDLFGRVGFLVADDVEKAKQGRAQHEKLEQWLPQQREFQGVYQIGDV